MSSSSGAKSIAEVLAEVEQQKIEESRRAAQQYAQRRQAEAQAAANSVAHARKVMSGAAMGGGQPTSAGTRPMASGGKGRVDATAAQASAATSNDLRDEFDYALEAVETAKKSLGSDMLAVEKMATNILMAKAGVSRDDAPRYIRKAIQYLDS